MTRFTTLIDTDHLAARLPDPSILVADCRFDLKDTDAGARAYAAGHIPGAVYVHLDHDLAGQKTGANGRHPLPDPATLAATFSRLGIDREVQVIAYDQSSGMYASRLWWMLRWLGHDAVAVLDGGFAKWTAEGRPTSVAQDSRAARRFQAALRPELLVTAKEVEAHLGDDAWRLLDARAPERYRGDIEPLDRVAGHIPGARNHFFQSNVDDAGTFRPPAELAEHFSTSTGPVAPDHVICYCGSGVTACHNLLALEHAGRPGAKLYAGSWSEWSADPAHAVERSTAED
jgi:thiosulfate/3-mercaptopyruvate sulfurtransferase